jgi:hypothetical protein
MERFDRGVFVMTHSPSFNGLKGLAQFSWNGIDGVLQLAIVLQKQIYELKDLNLKVPCVFD